ncbi:MAG: DUF2330 domain-containing protein [Flavobacteriales bacterium]|nr:DUF2330 domain-containing protein [Flavobacteriales bacterium]
MKRKIVSILFSALAMVLSTNAFAFCGFYVAKADSKLFNNKSEVILVRDGKQTVITMSNDYQGPMRDFAMVIPVPVVIQKDDIKVVDRRVFEVLDAYSAPRLVEYWDQNPCTPVYDYNLCFSDAVETTSMMKSEMMNEDESLDYGVKIEARYSVGEYDILVLSATESSGLKNWLLLNGYKIPEAAEQVLEPYIKSNTKFFVAKVNLDNASTGFDYLRPLQISFEHDKFMLPIRLGMANSQGEQDMIIYGFTRSGRIECTNYRTVKTPTDRNIPLYTQAKFGDFYKNLFDKAYQREGRNAVFLEYAWNVSPFNAVKCDPCVGNPPFNQDFVDAGIPWLNDKVQNPTMFFTRLHVRYGRNKFPSDLQFQVTPNNENFQCRYILTHPASGEFDCDEGQMYLDDLYFRRKKEVDEFFALTGKHDQQSYTYMNEYVKHMKVKPDLLVEPKRNEVLVMLPELPSGGRPGAMLIALGFTLAIVWFGMVKSQRGLDHA